MVTTRSGTRVDAQTVNPTERKPKRKNTKSTDTSTEPVSKIPKTDHIEGVAPEIKVPPPPAPTPATSHIAETNAEAPVAPAAPAPTTLPATVPTVNDISVSAVEAKPAVSAPAPTPSDTLSGATAALEAIKEPSPASTPMPEIETVISEPVTSITAVPPVSEAVVLPEVTSVPTETAASVPISSPIPAATAPAPASVVATVSAPSSVATAMMNPDMPTEFHENTPAADAVTFDGGNILNNDLNPMLIDDVAVFAAANMVENKEAAPVTLNNIAGNPLNLKTESYYNQVSETLAGIDSAVAAATAAQPSMIANRFDKPTASQAQKHPNPSSNGSQNNSKSAGALPTFL